MVVLYKGSGIKAGDDIYVDRGAYNHHGIYVHDTQVIHSDTTATIQCTTLKEFAEGAQVQVQQYWGEQCYDSPDVVERAKSQIGRANTHEVEQFPKWCITGDDVSSDDQVDGYLPHSLLPKTESDVSVLPLLLVATSTEALGGVADGPLRQQLESDLRHGPLSEGGRILESLKADTPEWRSLVARVLVDKELTAVVLGFTCAVINPLVPADNVGAPRINNRVDGILDMLSCEFTADYAQRLFLEVCESLAEASQSATLRRSVSTGQFVATATLGWFGMMGGPFTKGVVGAGDYVRRSFTKEHEYTSATAILTSVSLLLREQGAESEVTRIRRELGRQLSEAGRAMDDPRSTDAQDLKTRVARRALEILAPDGETEKPSEDGVPNVCGLTLENAESVLAAHGLTAEALDVGGVDGARRDIWKKANWTVVTQRPTADTPAQVGLVKLTVKKNAE